MGKSLKQRRMPDKVVKETLWLKLLVQPRKLVVRQVNRLKISDKVSILHACIIVVSFANTAHSSSYLWCDKIFLQLNQDWTS